MGIPKFFRWLSERYPLCSQLVNEVNVPEFDNFYLDMNGIIHNCSRAIAATGSPYTETEMFVAIFAYIQTLFEKIRPKKVFFLAVDGVAPRAKVNQQRARRFRSIKEAQAEAEKAARRKGGNLNGKEVATVKQERFDSNCITPGTEFMQRMSGHLRYLIAQRISEDVSWRNVQIIFSGPEVPGEGEHKVMEYIRLSKAKLDYDPNIRHCLYGLDADLILLGLLSHDPHFALLREEVTFGRAANTTKIKTAAETKFFLLHLCLMREYLDLEFRDLVLKDYSLEGIIDDFILLMCFVGNDFLPNLPGFHLGEGVLETLFATYKRALLSGGYINDNGKIIFQRLAVVLEELYDYERGILEVAQPTLFCDDGNESGERTGKLLTGLIEFLKSPNMDLWTVPIEIISNKEQKLLRESGKRFGLMFKIHDSKITLEKSTANAIIDQELLEELQLDSSILLLSPDEKIQLGWREWKRAYYLDKMHFDIDTAAGEASLHALLKAYGEGLQWNMFYYYEGVASWSWYYPYHYAPHITDLAPYLKHFKCPEFTMDRPLRPLEQLMAVLPPASSALLPKALSWLMTAEEGGVTEFYPDDFLTDANGKKASWEAIVLIPFIEGSILLPAIQGRYHLLDESERRRNEFGTTITFEFKRPGRTLDAPSPELPVIKDCPVHEVIYELPVLEMNERFVSALCQGARVGLYAMPGFPTLTTLPISGVLDSGIGLDIFGQGAKGLSMVLSIHPGGVFTTDSLEKIANSILGKRVFINWPHLREGVVDFITDGCRKYEMVAGELIVNEMNDRELDNFERMGEAIQKEYRRHCAVLTGSVDALVWVRPFVGMHMSPDGARNKQFSDSPVPCALQTIVAKRIDGAGDNSEDARYEETGAPSLERLEALFPVESTVTYLGADAYGTVGKVVKVENAGEIIVSITSTTRDHKDEFSKIAHDAMARINKSFMSATDVSRKVGISGYLLSKLTARLTLFLNGDLIRSSNIGLDLKSDAKGFGTVGLARRRDYWEFSTKVADLLSEIKRTFPDLLPRLEEERGSSNIEAISIFPGMAPTREALAEKVAPIQELIKRTLKDIVHAPIGSESLDVEAIKALKEVVTEHEEQEKQEKQEKGANALQAVKTVKASIEYLLCAETATPRLLNHNQPFDLGDRATFVGIGAIPFGVTGTIIGKDPTTLRILLDKPIIGGTDLDGLCEEGFGITVPLAECINLSNVRPPPGVKHPPGKEGKVVNLPVKAPVTRPAWQEGNLVGHLRPPTQNQFSKRPDQPSKPTGERGRQPLRTTITATKSTNQQSSIQKVPQIPVQQSHAAPKPGPPLRTVRMEDLFKQAEQRPIVHPYRPIAPLYPEQFIAEATRLKPEITQQSRSVKVEDLFAALTMRAEGASLEQTSGQTTFSLGQTLERTEESKPKQPSRILPPITNPQPTNLPQQHPLPAQKAPLSAPKNPPLAQQAPHPEGTVFYSTSRKELKGLLRPDGKWQPPQ